jgi:hypothetical protein
MFSLVFEIPAGVDPHCVNIDSAFVPPAGEFLFSPVGQDVTQLIPDYYDCDWDIIIGASWTCGDCDGNGLVNVSDIVLLINYVFADGPPPYPEWAGDVDCNGTVNVSDVVYLINYVFGEGPEPCEP